MDAMHLTDKEKEMPKYYMSGWKRSEIAKILCVTKSCMDYRKLRTATNTAPISASFNMPFNFISHLEKQSLSVVAFLILPSADITGVSFYPLWVQKVSVLSTLVAVLG